MNKITPTPITGMSLFLIIGCTWPRCFVSTPPHMMSSRIKTLLIQEHAMTSWSAPPKQVQMHTLFGMLVFLEYSMPKSCTSVLNLPTTPCNIWSFFGFNGSVKCLATILVWKLPNFPKLVLYLKQTIWHLASWTWPLLFVDAIFCHCFLKAKQESFSLLSFQEKSQIGWHTMLTCMSFLAITLLAIYLKFWMVLLIVICSCTT